MPPGEPKIYHITHVDNLSTIVDAFLWADAERTHRDLSCRLIGLTKIKQRRLRMPVACHPGTAVGDYVPFYFCPRSIMLYLLHRGNHPELNYRDGQRPIAHLCADLHRVVEWAESNGKRWAFTDANAGARYVSFFDDIAFLNSLDWEAIAATSWTAPAIKERKQAEFLVEKSFPWRLIESIAVIDSEVERDVVRAVEGASHRPEVVVARDWYY